MSLPVQTTPEADTQVREIDDWWRRNRGASPDMFLDEFGAACELISAGPLIGHPYRKSPVMGVRRVLLTRSRYHVYYVALDHEIRVLTVWHSRRGSGPPLRVE